MNREESNFARFALMTFKVLSSVRNVQQFVRLLVKVSVKGFIGFLNLLTMFEEFSMRMELKKIFALRLIL